MELFTAFNMVQAVPAAPIPDKDTPTKSQTLQVVESLKAAGQDFEWYPSTDAMLQAIAHCCGDVKSLLDIGAGDGRALKRIQQFRQAIYDRLAAQKDNYNHQSLIDSLYAIEKSPIHIQNMPASIAIVGTDFLQQSLIDKDVDAVFCNPPYSQYEEWAVKILNEAYCKYVFLILPERWKESPSIAAALKKRNTTARSIWAGDFTAADRPARARVEILQISLTQGRDDSYDRKGKQDPFDVWFESVFPEFDKIRPVKEEESDYRRNETEAKRLHEKIVPGQNLIETLAELYRGEMDSLYKNYRSLCDIDPVLLQELGVKQEDVKKGLRLKIDGNKNKYWTELFDHLDKITSRLTKATRRAMIEKLRSSCNVDFTADNAYAVVIWAVKNANVYINDQLVDLFRALSEPESVKNYKSNQKTWEKEHWRYKAEDHSRYTLDYRIVVQRQGGIDTTEYRHNGENGLQTKGHDFLQDIGTVANNLGFSLSGWEKSDQKVWESGKENTFKMPSLTGSKPLMSVRAYMNGNLHIKFDQEFIKTLNIEASRLLGWIKSPEQAAEEMGYSVAFCRKTFQANRIFADVSRDMTVKLLSNGQ
jgi:hypothetical protein